MFTFWRHQVFKSVPKTDEAVAAAAVAAAITPVRQIMDRTRKKKEKADPESDPVISVGNSC